MGLLSNFLISKPGKHTHKKKEGNKNTNNNLNNSQLLWDSPVYAVNAGGY